MYVVRHSCVCGVHIKDSELCAGFFAHSNSMGRICFRNLQVLVPEGADFKTIFIQCDLAPNGSLHPNACATEFREDDPAKRLGIKPKFNFKVSNEEKELWATLGGECNTKKLNSLVDFFGGQG